MDFVKSLNGVEEAVVVAVVVTLLVVYLCSLLRRRYRSKVRKEYLQQLTTQLDYQPESAKPDSPYLFGSVPECQFSVWCEAGGKRSLVGHGYRDRVRDVDFLVAPTHVVSCKGLGQVTLVVHRTTNGVHEVVDEQSLHKYKWEEIASDLSIARVPVEDIPKGLRVASIGPYAGKLMASIATSMAQSNASVGKLQESGFGVLEYTGSTRPGFSGAVYLAEKRAVAMHLGGGVANLAYATSYIRNLVVTCESSEYEALRRVLNAARRKDWEFATTGDPDMMQIRCNGRYWLVDQEEFLRIKAEFEPEEDEWERVNNFEGGFVKRGRRARRRDRGSQYADAEFYEGPGTYGEDVYDYEPESGNVNGARKGPSSGTTLKQDVDMLQQLLSEFVEKVSISQEETRVTLGGQIDTLKQLSDHFSSTQKSLAEQDLTLRNLTSENAKLRAHFSQLQTKLDSITISPPIVPPKRAGTDSSDCSEVSTCRVVQDLEYFPEAKQMGKPLVGTASDVRIESRSKPSESQSRSASESSSEKSRKRKAQNTRLREKIMNLQQQISRFSSSKSPIVQQSVNQGGSV